MKLNSFQKTAIITIGSTLFLIFVGSLVRAAGAGLGCPDWPKCFGSWIPPLSIGDLPSGFDPAQFNVLKTWLEYLNRLIGVIIGIFIIATFIQSFRYRKLKPIVFISTTMAFILVLFQGWLGGQVVLSELKEWLITIHMITALIILSLLILGAYKSLESELKFNLEKSYRKKIFYAGSVVLLFTLVQTGFGTQVREVVDSFINNIPELSRIKWPENLGELYVVHRSFSWVVIISIALLIFFVRKAEGDKVFFKVALWISGLAICQIIIGLCLASFGIYPVLQIFHLFNSSILICTEFIFLLFVYDSIC